ncbi:hypothetical protein CH375_17455 [Leptospira ellisii]|uniref:Uncharacterized protein n=1 Tax=Leptospira ellisii TaxID=2023197 RepID=A0A2N0BHC5_9LEPT|nr:hypothetical protein CH379_07895 [Leptospira ellisii]PKA03360.1 hypothetical protein CH375_17455 [Leptospira ellisii]
MITDFQFEGIGRRELSFVFRIGIPIRSFLEKFLDLFRLDAEFFLKNKKMLTLMESIQNPLTVRNSPVLKN